MYAARSGVRLVVRLALAAAVALSLAGPASAASGPQPGDLVRVTVYGQPDLTTLARVGENNQISFPFIGQVQVGGLSNAEAQSNIARALEQNGIVRNPQVTLLVETAGVLGSDFVTVLGQVRQPGRYPLGSGSESGTRTLLDLLATAGGSTEEANSKVLLFRKSGDQRSERREIDMDDLLNDETLNDSNVELLADDVVIVPKSDVFYIYGQVKQPGRYPLDENMMVMHAISLGGGVTERGSENGVVLTRRSDAGDERMTVDLEHDIRPGDIIYVKERFF